MKRIFLWLTLISFSVVAPLAAQEFIAPPEVVGEAVYIPFPVTITVDGELDDWANIAHTIVDRGPMTSSDPQENGSFSFAVAADDENFYLTLRSGQMR
jgi:hypothetical protein